MRNLSQTQQQHFFIKKKNDRPVIKSGNPKEETTEDVSVPKDLNLVALPQLCFPGGLQITKEQKDEHFHFLVFTDVFGNQSHGVVLQYCRSIQVRFIFYITWILTSHYGCCPQFHIAYAICVISKHPYYNALKDCLSSLLDQLKICQFTDMEEQVKEFSAKLALVPVPSPGQLYVVFTLRPLTIVLPSREDKNHPIIDLDLHLPLFCFKSRELLQIIASILTEQRMVFFSSDWAKLTLIIECFMLYIWPLHWQHPLVPILSQQMLDFVMAPTTFLMGCHTSHYEDVAKLTDDLILINIDEGTVSCSGCHYVDVPDIPQAAAQRFKRKGLQLHYDLEMVHQRICSSLHELRMQRRHWQHRLNSDIQNITLELIVNMFRDVSDNLNYEHRVFNTDEFLKTREPDDKPFYKKVLETHIFHSFLKERLNGKRDKFTQMELSTQTEDQKSMDYSRRPTIKDIVSRNVSLERGLSKRLGSSLPDLDNKKHLTMNTPVRPFKIFQLPDFPSPLNYPGVLHYFGDLILQLNKAISATPPDDSSLLARYFYLRGLINMLSSKRLDALSDFQNLYKTDIAIFPGELVKTLMDSLQMEERVQVEKRSELKRLICQMKNNEKSEHVESDYHVKKFELPKTPMQLEEFVMCTQQSGIVRDMATSQRLFEALIVGGEKHIHPEMFRVFYSFWKQAEAEAQDIDLPAEVLERLDNNECVYKLSSSVKTSYGAGKIAMTQKRLFLLTCRCGYVEIAKFRDIEEVNISVAPLLRIPSLKIKNSQRKEIFEANLKSECELWNLMVKEMWAGRMMTDNHKDPQCVQQALTNVLLMDAVVACLKTQKAIFAASKLAYFEKQRQEVPMIIPRPTAETLKHKINPSQNMTHPQSVDVLLYTPGLDVEGNPKLWCALSCGKVVVFDAVSWSLMQNCIHLGESRLVRCYDRKVIYIKITLCRNVILMCFPSQAQVYSCSADGTVIVWDVPSLKVKRQFHLSCERLQSIQINNDDLWCGKFNFTDSAELCIWDSSDPLKAPKQVTVPNCSGVTCMIRVKDQVWIGCNGGPGLSKVVGKIFVLDSESLKVEKELEAHEDTVQTLFSAEDRYILSGSAKSDGKIAIWRAD
uniref:DENN/MADD domain containing 3b n=1 Tax=Cyprinus carpio TaxID=7962 RepID=A0A8C1ZGL2_CYPCA